MSLKIRLSRGGAKKRPYYRVVIADSRSPRDGKFIERVGSYNPMLTKDHEDRVLLKEDRIKHWMGLGALPTDRVARFLSDAGLMEAAKRPEQTKQDKPKAKALERLAENESKAAEAAETAAAAAAAPVEEAPVEEAVAEEAVAEAVPEAAEVAEATEAPEAAAAEKA